MKKVSFILMILGIGLILLGFVIGKDNFSAKKVNKIDNNNEVMKSLFKTISLKHHNVDDPTIITLTFPVDLTCDYINEYDFSCKYNNGSDKDRITASYKTNTGKYNSSSSLNEFINQFKDKQKLKNVIVTDINSGNNDIKCVRTDTINEDSKKNVSNKSTSVYIVISDGNDNYTFLNIYYNYFGEDKKTIVDEHINSFINSIKIEKYVEEEKKYLNDKLDISLTVPRFNNANKIKLYLDKNKYKYSNSLYENTNNIVQIQPTDVTRQKNIIFVSTITIKYLYSSNSKKNGSLLSNFANGIPIVERLAKKMTIDGKEVYYNDGDKRFFLHVINEHYAYYVESTKDLSDDELKDLFNFTYENN